MDDEVFAKKAADPTRGPAAGLGELQTLRLLLDTCGSVAEAKEALLQAKQYYAFVPVHYLIADRFGNAFIWEYSPVHNREHILEDPSKPLVMTNFTLHSRSSDGRPPTVEQARALTSFSPSALAAFARLRAGKQPVDPDPSLDLVEGYLYQLNGERPDPGTARALDAYFIVGAEHGFNASTFTARVITSTRSDIASAVAGAIGMEGVPPAQVFGAIRSRKDRSWK